MKKLHGTGVALVTPFTDTEEVDFKALKTLLDHTAQGVDYYVVMGTTGEPATLEHSEKESILRFVKENNSRNLPIVYGAGGNNTRQVVDGIRNTDLQGVDAILSVSPYYNKPSQEGIYQHFMAIADASPVPVILYNVPGRTGRNMTAATTLRLAREIPNIVGIKEASGDMAQCMELLRDRPADFLVISGDDALTLPQIACGMDGVISVAANCFAREFTDMVRFCLKGDFKSAKTLNDKLIAGYELLFAENNPAGAKAFCFELGLIQNYLRLPVTPVSDELHHKIRTYLGK